MSQRSRGRAEARERIAEMRAEQERRERKRRVTLVATAIGTVVAVIVALVALRAAGVGSGDDSTDTASSGKGAASQTVMTGITATPAAAFDAVGAGSVNAVPKSIEAPALTADGKPRVLYVGAEYCPFCAGERWPLIVALSRFGTWSGLTETTSSSKDVHPDTPTLSFTKAKYTSDYVAFGGFELQDREGKQLQKLSSADEKVFKTYNKDLAYPFVDLGGKATQVGASYDMAVLSGKTHDEIAKAISDPSSDIGKGVLGVANVYTAEICGLTDNKPANVCTSAGVKAGQSKLSEG